MTNFYPDGFDSKPTAAMYQGGKNMRVVHAKHAITAAALADGDTFVLAGPMSMEARIHRILSPNATPALTSASDNDIGFYYKAADGTLTVIDKDILVDGMTLASALSARDLLLHGNSALDATKNIGALLSLQPDKGYAGGVYLVLTMNTKSTHSGTLALDLDVVIEEATTE